MSLLPLSKKNDLIVDIGSASTSRSSSPSSISVYSEKVTPRNPGGDSAWADGLRGIAAVFVMSSHLVLTLERSFLNPCCGPDEKTPTLFQRPIFRLIASGQAWVSIFILLSGFVNALKPLKHAREGEVQKALGVVAVSSYRRSFRLMLPATAASFVSWLFEQLGLYYYARNGEAYWTRVTSPPTIDSLSGRVKDFFVATSYTWSFSNENHYDQPQWALKYLLFGSMLVFLAIIATAQLKPFWRAALLMLLYTVSQDWSYKFLDPLVGMNIFAGVLLAELHLIQPLELNSVKRYRTLVTHLAPVALIIAAVLMSVPMDRWDRAPWSNAIMNTSIHFMLPQPEPPRVPISLGGQLLVLTVLFSPWLRRLLSAPSLLWLGKVSFSIYLLHGPLLRSLFSWCLYIGSEPLAFPKDGSQEGEMVTLYPLPGGMRILLSLGVFLGVLGVAAHAWTMKLEPVFAKLTKRAENMMFARQAGIGLA